MRGLSPTLRNKAARFVLPAVLLVLYLYLRVLISSAQSDPSAAAHEVNGIRAAAAVIKPDDVVLLSTGSAAVQQVMEQTGASVKAIDATNWPGFETDLVHVLDGYCGQAAAPSIYYVWTEDTPGGALELGKAARAVNFFFQFQALLPYEGYNAYAVDKILRLEPKWEAIARYCDALALAGGRDVVAILSPGDFSPWIGSMRVGRVTWLASDPTRTMTLSDFTVENLPPVTAYDANWMGITESGFTWTYNNSDAEAYREVFSRPGVKDTLLLAGNAAVIGPVTEGYVRECDGNFFGGLFLRRICLN
jgi:hypothetical protein